MNKDSKPFTKYIGEVALENQNADISAMIVVDEKIILAEKRARVLLKYGRNLQKINKTILTGDGFEDLAVVRKHEFAAVSPGLFYSSEVSFFYVEDDYIRANMHLTVTVDPRCFGICFRRDYLFATFSPIFSQCYVKMYHERGISETTILRPGELCDAKGLSKIYVDEQFRLRLSEVNNKEILVFKYFAFNNFFFEVAHSYAVNGMVVRKDGLSFFATKSGDGVIMMHPEGQWTFNNFLREKRLGGKSMAVAIKESEEEQVLYVLVNKTSLCGFCNSYKIVAFKLETTSS